MNVFELAGVAYVCTRVHNYTHVSEHVYFCVFSHFLLSLQMRITVKVISCLYTCVFFSSSSFARACFITSKVDSLRYNFVLVKQNPYCYSIFHLTIVVPLQHLDLQDCNVRKLYATKTCTYFWREEDFNHVIFMQIPHLS